MVHVVVVSVVRVRAVLWWRLCGAGRWFVVSGHGIGAAAAAAAWLAIACVLAVEVASQHLNRPRSLLASF